MKVLRLNIVFMLCGVFLLRMLFTDISLMAASSTTNIKQAPLRKAPAKTQVLAASDGLKEINIPQQKQETFFEICEEDTDSDDELIKDHSFLFAYVFTLINQHHENQPTKAACSGNVHSITSSDPCILFQVFRI